MRTTSLANSMVDRIQDLSQHYTYGYELDGRQQAILAGL